MAERDQSPVRRIVNNEQTLFSIECPPANQRLLIYLGAVLQCDTPILEALYHRAPLAFLRPKGPNFDKRIRKTMWAVVTQYFKLSDSRRLHKLAESFTHRSICRLNKSIAFVAVQPLLCGDCCKNTRLLHRITETNEVQLIIQPRNYPNRRTYRSASIRPGCFEQMLISTIQIILNRP